MSTAKFDVTALGELLIDFTENGVSGQGNTIFEANPGGAPCNVLAMLKKLDRSCAVVGKVGDDMFGRLLKDVAERTGSRVRDRVPKWNTRAPFTMSSGISSGVSIMSAPGLR